MTSVAARVTGRVQGVGFRLHAAREADRLGVSGWVRNAADGSVELHAEGDGDAVDRLVDWLRTGPPSARVESVTSTDVPAEGASGFRIGG